MLFKHFRRASLFSAASLVLGLFFVESSYGQSQTFSSGSTGADGALNITAPGVTYFNPAALTLNPVIPNLFNFTTITIAAGSTLKFTEEVFHGPVFFLASGDVVISGTLDLSGGNGIPVTSGLQSDRLPSYAGSGGFGGGLGNVPNGVPAPGNGPGGGADGKYGSTVGTGGQFTGNPYLVPLIGGSGGGGGYCSTGGPGDGGGAGGGAILIASSTSITINATGMINASGGGGPSSCGGGGGGSGGAIRLMAPIIAGSSNGADSISVLAGGYASNGKIRLEAFTDTYVGVVRSPISRSVPFAIALPASAPGSLTVTSINGVTINANPFSFPDTTINSSGPVTIKIQAQYIPPGTVPKLTVFSDTGADQVIACSPLSGTLQSSTSTATVTFPTGGSRGFVKATWTQ